MYYCMIHVKNVLLSLKNIYLTTFLDFPDNVPMGPNVDVLKGRPRDL